MIGIYFSGTGNTQYCLKKFIKTYDESLDIISIEDAPKAIKAISQHEAVILAYPVYYSNLPKVFRDFILEHKDIWKNKKIFLISTMGLWSGDGCGVAARLLKKQGAHITGALQIQMPDCISDVKLLKRTPERNRRIVQKADAKLKKAALKLKNDSPAQEGLSFFAHFAGLFCQRLWFSNKTKHYSDQLKIDLNSCMGCGHCASVCPMHNLSMNQGKPLASDQCTMCYRCITQCPKKAITLIGTKVAAQYTIKDFL